MSAAGARAASLALLAALAVGVWVHRIELDAPSAHTRTFQADTYRYFWPAAVYQHAELSRGRLPLWNPYQLAGQPYLALHAPALLYPANLLSLALLPPHAALALQSALNLFVAGLFTWLFAGRLGLSAPARLAAAATYLLCRPLELGLYMPPYLATPAWLPAVFWALHGLASEVRARWAVALGAFFALAFLGGHAQAFVYIAQLALAYGIFALVALAPQGARLRVAALAALAGLIAAGLAAPQILPALELAGQAVRGLSGVSLQQAALSSADPTRLARGMLRGLSPAWLGPFEPMLGLPLLALPLALVALAAPVRRAHAWLFAGAAIAVGLLMLGPHTPFFGLYYQLPLGNLFRGPSRASFAWSFLFAMLLGLGIERLRELRGAARAPRAVAALLALAVGLDAYALTRLEPAHPAATGDYLGTSPELVAFLRDDPGRGRAFVETFGWYSTGALEKLGMMNGVFAVGDYEPSMPAAYAEYFAPDTRQPWHGRLHVVAGGQGERAAHLAALRLLDLMAVRWYALEAPAPPAVLAALRAATGGSERRLGAAHLFERADALPRAWAVRRVRWEPTPAAGRARLLDPAFRPREEAVLIGSEPAGDGPVAGELLSSAAAEPDAVALTVFEAERVGLRAECGARCLVVLPELYYPGWQATVDGHEAPIERVNLIFRGVWLEPGVHAVELRYAPASFRAGVALFAATLVACAAALGYARRGRRARRSS